MSRLERFDENPDAQRLQASGIKLAKQGDYQAAHEIFSDAIGSFFGPSAIEQQSARLQIARIIRDDGFTYVREALNPEVVTPASFLETGLKRLMSAQVWTEMLKQKGSGHYSSEAWWRLRAEHGATLGLIARLATVAYVLEIPHKIKPLSLYIDAHKELSPASNRYYETSNAMNAARQMVIEGNTYSARSVWLGRARRSAERTTQEDPNQIAARRDIRRREKFLKSPRVARNSVFRAP